MFFSEIFLLIKTSSPKRIGTLTREVFLKMVGCPALSIAEAISKRTALEPMSIAAYFSIFMMGSDGFDILRVYFYNTDTFRPGSAIWVVCFCGKRYLVFQK